VFRLERDIEEAPELPLDWIVMLWLHQAGRRGWQRDRDRQQGENKEYICRSYAGTKAGR
jgi:hypothetical protein